MILNGDRAHIMQFASPLTYHCHNYHCTSARLISIAGHGEEVNSTAAAAVRQQSLRSSINNDHPRRRRRHRSAVRHRGHHHCTM